MDFSESDLDLLLLSVDPFPERAVTPAVLAALDDVTTPRTTASGRRTTRRRPRSRRLLAGLAAGGVLAVGGVAAAATPSLFVSNKAPDFIQTARAATAGIPLPPGDSMDTYIRVFVAADPGDLDRDTVAAYFSYDATCAWEGYWLQAYDSGDTAVATKALAVLQGIPDWPQSAGDGDMTDLRMEVAKAADGDAGPVRQAWSANCTELPRAWATK